MKHTTRNGVLVVALAFALLPAGCGGSGTAALAPPVVKDPFAYDASKPLRVELGDLVSKGPVNVRSLTYAAQDGSRVPALLAVPRDRRVAGCLMYQPGVYLPKEAAAPLWPGAAKLGLAMFTIDVRGTGARAGGPVPLSQMLNNTDMLVTLLRNDVVDLRRGLDYLERQPVCHHNVGYLGWSNGAVLGVLLSGADRRIRATVLASIGATWRARMFYSPYVLQGVVNDPSAFKAAVTQLSPYDQARWISKIAPRPVMIVDGLNDPAIPPIDALDLAAAARPPKTMLFDSGGHDPFHGPQAAGVAKRIKAFLTANLVHHGDT